MSLKNTIQQLVSSNKVTIFSKTYCPYCTNAKKLFAELGVDYKAIELDTMKEGTEYQNTLKEMTNQSTVPSVWVNGEFIGGFSDTSKLHQQGKLVSKLGL
ncbi:predicted protein [Naegleria gruberi]|uniref:Predicted protein n=1 Tax=Naegleria gruberi TaxID=5762 RepID=D2V984_NAEGR|nr:uncharacterized protein NAEGRDRAFT_32248 [Naegleria gruberi]EFC46544.1 predicted protein [Naegleria gruberi]|eukprot:XP_002679288.1 predicted protein [Naegleria gruberi strain NEG-M]